jgi:type II secretory pathway pseudopilin PulG
MLRRRQRAYLMLEAAIGGTMVAVIIGAILTSLSQARTMNVVVERDLTASQLVTEALERQRALGFAGVVAVSATPVPGVTGRFLRGITVAACTETVPAPGTNLSCKDVTVTVTYTTSLNARLGTSTTRTAQATARVYQ